MAKRKIFKTVKGFLYMIIGCGLLLTLFNSMILVYQHQDEVAVLKKQKAAVVKEKKSLENEIDLLNNEDYVARYARENYVFTRDGEQVSIIPGVKE